jgi:hypothetical protein
VGSDLGLTLTATVRVNTRSIGSKCYGSTAVSKTVSRSSTLLLLANGGRTWITDSAPTDATTRHTRILVTAAGVTTNVTCATTAGLAFDSLS